MTTKTTIKGAPRKYSEVELKQRQEDYHNAYRNTRQCLEQVRSDGIAANFLSAVIEKSMQGYTLRSDLPVSSEAFSYSCYMLKPENIQEADLLLLDEQVKQQYIIELKAERATYEELLTKQLLEVAEEKERQKLAASKAKQLDAIQREVADCFGDLGVPE